MITYLLPEVARCIRGNVSAELIGIAHIEMTLALDSAALQRAVLSLVSTEAGPALSHTLEQKLSRGGLLPGPRFAPPWKRPWRRPTPTHRFGSIEA